VDQDFTNLLTTSLLFNKRLKVKLYDNYIKFPSKKEFVKNEK